MRNRMVLSVLAVLDLIGIVWLFLPVDWGTSPWHCIQAILQGWGDESCQVALPTILAMLVWAGNLRLFHSRAVGSWEFYGCCAIVLLLNCPFLFTALQNVAKSGVRWNDYSAFVYFFLQAVPWVVVYLVRKRRQVAFEYMVPITLRCGFLPNVIFFFFEYVWKEERGWKEALTLCPKMQIGGRVGNGIIYLYLAEVVFLIWCGVGEQSQTESLLRVPG